MNFKSWKEYVLPASVLGAIFVIPLPLMGNFTSASTTISGDTGGSNYGPSENMSGASQVKIFTNSPNLNLTKSDMGNITTAGNNMNQIYQAEIVNSGNIGQWPAPKDPTVAPTVRSVQSAIDNATMTPTPDPAMIPMSASVSQSGLGGTGGATKKLPTNEPCLSPTGGNCAAPPTVGNF